MLVLWSGGCDSTLVLYDLARTEGTKEKPIRTLTIVHPQVLARREQAKARIAILKKFKEDGLHVQANHIVVHQSGGLEVSAYGNAQSILWLSTAVLYLEDKEKLYTGHNMDDGDIWPDAVTLNVAFTNLCQVGCRESSWVTPLIFVEKRQILQRLKDAGLLDLCWWCENPQDGKPCRNCNPCILHETAMWQLKRWGSVSRTREG